MAHLQMGTIWAYHFNCLSPKKRAQVEKHAQQCERCMFIVFGKRILWKADPNSDKLIPIYCTPKDHQS
jgi:hypothetical protein